MKKYFVIIMILACIKIFHSCKTAENDPYAKILESKNIANIENFLETTHKDDPRSFILKPRLIALKNAELEQKTIKARQLVAKPVYTYIPNPNSAEAEVFKKLMSENSSPEHQQKTVKFLNAMFDQDITSKESILLIQNKSDCNMILRIEGNKFYNLAVPSKSENSLVLPKGNYRLSSNVCDVKYSSTQKITKNMMVTLQNPTLVEKTGVNTNSSNAQK